MAAFYGSITGAGATETRTGTKASGIKVSAQSYDGSVISELIYNDKNTLMIRISTDDGSSSYGSTVFYGTFEEFKNKLKA